MQTATGLYFGDGEIVANVGKATVYIMDNNYFLEVGPGHNLVASEIDYAMYMEQLGDKPKGNCLEIGLGLGIGLNVNKQDPNLFTTTTTTTTTTTSKTTTTKVPPTPRRLMG